MNQSIEIVKLIMKFEKRNRLEAVFLRKFAFNRSYDFWIMRLNSIETNTLVINNLAGILLFNLILSNNNENN